MRRQVPFAIVLIAGLAAILQLFVPHPFFAQTADTLQRWATILISVAFILGIGNVVRINLEKVARKKPQWGYPLVTLISLAVMLLFGLFPKEAVCGDSTGFFCTILGHTEPGLFRKLYTYTYAPMQGTMFSLLAFYIVSASYRAFKIRSWEATILGGTALLVLLGNVPLPFIHEPMTNMKEWIMSVPQLAPKRAILIGAALGAVATGLKMIFGIERSYEID